MGRKNCPAVKSLGESFRYSVQLETCIYFSVSPVSFGELPHLGGNPHSATAGGVPGSWTRGERGVKDLEIASEKLRHLSGQSSAHTSRCN